MMVVAGGTRRRLNSSLERDKPLATQIKYYHVRGRKIDVNCVKYIYYFPETQMGMVHYVGTALEDDKAPHGNTKRHNQPYRPTSQISKDYLLTQSRFHSMRQRMDDARATLDPRIVPNTGPAYYHGVLKQTPRLMDFLLQMDVNRLSTNEHFKASELLSCRTPVMTIWVTPEARQEVEYIAQQLKNQAST